MIKYFTTLTNKRGDALVGYRVQVVDANGAAVSIYADASGTLFPGSVNYATADSEGLVEFYWNPASGHVLQTLDPAGNLIKSVADFAAVGAGAVAFIQSGTGSVERTAQAKLRDVVSVLDFTGVDPTGATDSTTGIQAAEDHCSSVGAALFWPPGTYRTLSTINKKNGVNWIGSGRHTTATGLTGTVIDYRGNSYAVDARGTSPSRIICTIRDIGFLGTNGGVASQGIRIGWNMRCKLLDNVRFEGFGHYGINFDAENWDLVLHDVDVKACGNRTAGSSGIYANPAIPTGSFNAISLTGHWAVEGCGTNTSVGGGFSIRTNVAQRSLTMGRIDCEGNLGTYEICIENFADVQANMYMEIDSSAGTAGNAMLLKGVQGQVTGFIRGAAGFATQAIRVEAGTGGNVAAEVVLDCLHLSGFSQHVSGQNCKIIVRSVFTYAPDGPVIYTADPTCFYNFVGERGAAVADATDAASAITQLNALLARMRAKGEIAA